MHLGGPCLARLLPTRCVVLRVWRVQAEREAAQQRERQAAQAQAQAAQQRRQQESTTAAPKGKQSTPAACAHPCCTSALRGGRVTYSLAA